MVGLLWSITSRHGIYGQYTQEYTQFTNQVEDEGTVEFWKAQEELEARYGKPATPDYLLYVLWLGTQVLGVLRPSYLMQRLRKLRHWPNFLAELEEVTELRNDQVAQQKYGGFPELDDLSRAQFIADGLAALSIGAKQDEELKPEDAQSIKGILGGLFKELSREDINDVLDSRKDRQLLYK